MSDQTITVKVDPGASWSNVTVNVAGDSALLEQVAKLTASLADAQATITKLQADKADMQRRIDNLK